MQLQAQKIEVLVLDGDMIPALAIVRSLGTRGLRVSLASHLAKPLAGYSRFAVRTLRYPDPLKCENEFLRWCKQTIDGNTFALVIPVTERTLVPLQRLMETGIGIKIASAPPKTLATVLDKNKTMVLAAELGITVPKSVVVRSLKEDGFNSTDLKFPTVIKPISSIGNAEQERKQLTVEYAFDACELESKLHSLLRYGPALLQEYVPGAGVGIELIADRGEIVYAFQHRRLHEIPLTGGGSSYRKSTAIDPELLEATRRLISALDWHGVAMVEFKWDSLNRTYALMEVNGRFWGSLPLAVAAGADFPSMLYELYLSGVVNSRPPAKIGVYCRKLSSDLNWTELVFRRLGPPELVHFPSMLQVMRDWLMVFHWNHNFDVQQWRDPLPGAVDFQRIVNSHFSRTKKLLTDKFQLKKQILAWRNGKVEQRLRAAQQILFICYGNINRSALAERCAEQYFPKHRLIITSAGFHEEEGRGADPMMVQVAADKGIDLNEWSSSSVNSQMVRDSDIIFAMEMEHVYRMCLEFPETRGKIFLLNAGSEVPSRDVEIADPYGKARTQYEECAQIVISCVLRLAKALSR
jgi:protein-tyrosine-phosphatase/carbamoylphosphate synthase large subunit